MPFPSKSLVVGGGKMGGALLAGWLERGMDPATVTVVEPNPEIAAALGSRLGVAVRSVPPAPQEPVLGEVPEVVLFAVKPQVMETIVPAYKSFTGEDTVFLSIAAGRTIGFFETHLGRDAAVIRAMPNTPAAIGRGISVLCANANVKTGQKELCQTLLEAVGETAWIANEALMDAVTAVSGSGPAYVFLLAECLAEAGRDAGLPDDLARRLAEVTVSGAGELMRLEDAPPSLLRRNVTSPGGTTHAALEILMANDGLGALMNRAVAAAAKRSKELAEA
ncbi:MAG TPA: pyrroline-5-carboxylate reductase [Alphaproteobacteria bacterium]|nr:pyrroline-5-carboxylate reductase [Alphaproteobacteria bacterium]